jgi:hypothetical protein
MKFIIHFVHRKLTGSFFGIPLSDTHRDHGLATITGHHRWAKDFSKRQFGFHLDPRRLFKHRGEMSG